MARSHGKILVDIWLDPDFLRLSSAEQWAYFMLLSQPKMNLVGCIDYEPHRWATFAPNLTEQDVIDAVVGLECARFVCVDVETRELLVRSMTRHDGLRTNNPKLLKGLWGQWKGITSQMLRKVAVDNMPGHFFDGDECPKAALETRRSARTDCAIGWSFDPQSDHQSFRPPPSTIRHPPTAGTQSPERSDARSDSHSSSSESGAV